MTACLNKVAIGVLLLCSTSAIADDVCEMSTQEQHKAAYEKVKLPPIQSVFESCGFGDLLDFGDITGSIFEKLKDKAGSVGVCGFTGQDLWDKTTGGKKWPGDVIKDVQRETEDDLNDAIKKIEFPISINKTTSSKGGDSQLYNVIFGDG
jgi:hypothetical protein